MADRYTMGVSLSSNVDVSDRVRAYEATTVTNAEEGSVAISTIILDDPNADINVLGLRPFARTESAEHSNFRYTYRGWIAGRNITRGDSTRTSLRTERSRQWSVDLADVNSLLSRRLMRGSDANRPAETDTVRLAWLLGTNELGSIITDDTYVNYSGGVAMDANDYRNQGTFDILNDLHQASGKNFFALYNEITQEYGLFYDFQGSTAYSSEVRITNSLVDVDSGIVTATGSNSTYAAMYSGLNLNRNPDRVYSGVVVPYVGGDEYVEDAAIFTTFTQRRDTTAPSINVHSAAKARARGIRYLRENADEVDRLTIGYQVPLAKVNHLKEGQRFQVKFTHLPGYTDWTWVRALNRRVIAKSEDFYDVIMDASGGGSVASCAVALAGLSMYDSGMISGGPPCSVSPSSPSVYPSVVLDFMVMATDNTCIGPPVVGPNLTISGFTEAQKYQGAPAACEHSLLGVGYKALTGGSPGSFSYNYTGNGCETFRVIGINIPTAATAPVQVAQQDQSGSTVTLGATPTPGNLLVMFRSVETNNWTATPGTGWTQIGTQVDAHVGISNHKMDVWCRCVQSGDGTTWGNGDASLTHWTFISEWALT